MKITIFYIPCGDENAAAFLSESAIKVKYAACGNIVASKSIFPWHGELKGSSESILILKTTLELKDALAGFIAANHQYEVPCVMHWEVEVNEDYGKWISECVAK